MKLEINERICDGMNSKKRITASYLRDQKGLKRTETDGLCKEGTELSLKTLYILCPRTGYRSGRYNCISG